MQKTILFILTTIFFAQVYSQNILEGKRVLWIGTSIPAHCTYPKNACENLGMTCRNHAIGASFLSIRPFSPDEEIETHTGYALSMSSAEKEELYQPWLQEGRITRHRLDVWKFSSYDQRIIQYLDSTDIIVIDHGYNDAHNTLQAEYERGRDSVDWDSDDRSTFIGAFNYVYNRIKEVKPDAIIAIGGYFQNTCSVMPRGRYVSEVSTWIAEHYDLPLLDVWNYTDVPDGYVPNSANYIENLNRTYGTEYKPRWTDEQGNITWYQLYCPDGTHPWSDPTGHSDHVLDSIFTSILPTRLEPYLRHPASNLMFNELMANNIETLLYNHHYPDSWFELYNPTSREINLRNWRVSSRNDYSTAYTFNHFKYVPVRGHAFICCDGRDDHWEHTDFKLDPDQGGALYLWDPEGNLVDSIRYPAAPCPDVSWGRILDGSAHWQFKCSATAGSANRSEGTMVQLPAPTIRLVDDSIEIAVEPFDAPTNTYLYYTCDGSTPTFSSPRIAVGSPKRLPDEGSQVVRARLLSPHAMPSPTTTRSFIHHPRPTNLPIISLSTDNYNLYSEEDGILIGSDWNDNCFKQWERPLYLEYFEPADSQQPTANGQQPSLSQLVQAITYGQGSLVFSQKSLRIEAISRYGNDQFDTSRFWPSKPQVRHARAFLLRNGGDRALDTRFEDAFVQELFGQHVRDIEYQAYRPVIVYINGLYRGIYELRETVDEAWVESNISIPAADVTLIESFTSSNPSYRPVLDLLSDETATFDDYERVIDIPLFIDYLCAECFATNDNYPHNNVTLWCSTAESTQRLHALLCNLDYVSTTSNQTNWLYYLTCTGYEAGSVRRPEAHQLFIRLLALPEFQQAFIDRMMVYLGDFCRPSVTIPMVERMRDEIATEVASTFAILREHPNFERDFLGNIEKRLLPYCAERPLLLYSNLYSTFHLKDVYRLTVQGADSINGIPLTEGDFNGCCFHARPVRLAADSLKGWELTLMRIDSTLEHYSYPSPNLCFLPADLGEQIDSIGFVARPLDEMLGIRELSDDPSSPGFPTSAQCKVLTCDLLGRRTTTRRGIRVEIRPDGTAHKLILRE